jgi:predicted nucleotidyltransferase
MSRKELPVLKNQAHSRFSLFDTVPPDSMGFGLGASFSGKSVQSFLGLKKEDVSRLADVSPKSVRFDDAMPEPVRECLQEMAVAINWVAKVFGGDVDKTVAWFQTRNPLLGDISPRDMIRLGRFERLRKFILVSLQEAPKGTAAQVHGLDPATAHAVQQFRQLLKADFAAKELIVYGSRARGDHRPDSDADVAVLMDGAHKPFLDTKLKMSDAAYDVLLDTGINISPLPIWLDEWAHPETYVNPALLANIAREGVRL